MKYVIDSSVGFKWVVPEPDSDKALRLRQHHEQAIHELLAPDIFSLETGHALTRAESQKRIPVGTALLLLTDVANSLPSYHPSLLFLLRACEISSKARVGIYDCIYVALGEKEGCEVVTADATMI
jgi:predicted nucleic acid-binding protein